MIEEANQPLKRKIADLEDELRAVKGALASTDVLVGLKQEISNKTSEYPFFSADHEDGRVEAMAWSATYRQWGNSYIRPLKQKLLGPVGPTPESES